MKRCAILLAPILAAVLLGTSCAHVQLLGPRQDWMGKTHEFRDYSITIPENSRWWPLPTVPSSQNVALGVPNSEKMDARPVLTKEGDTGMLLLQASGGMTHPNEYDMFIATIEILATPIPAEVASRPDEELVALYLQDHLAYCVKAGVLSVGSQYDEGTMSIADKKYTVLSVPLDKKVNHEIVIACTVFRGDNSTLIVAGKLRAPRATEADVDYLKSILASVDPK